MGVTKESDMEDAVIISAVRTPVGGLGGTLGEVSAIQLGATAIEETLNRAHIAVEDVDEVLRPGDQQIRGVSVTDAEVGRANSRRGHSDRPDREYFSSGDADSGTDLEFRAQNRGHGYRRGAGGTVDYQNDC